MPLDISIDVRFGVSVPRTPQVMGWMKTAMQRSVERILRRAQANLSGRFLRVRSGRGIGSLRTKVQASREIVVGTVGTPVFYLRILQQGFPAQELTTTKKGFAFFRGGQLIRTKSISHPGVVGRPWLSTAAEESREDVIAAFNEVPAQIARFIMTEPNLMKTAKVA
jgi:hypothetical protein